MTRENGERHWLRWLVTAGTAVLVSVVAWHATTFRREFELDRDTNRTTLVSHEFRLSQVELALAEVRSVRLRQDQQRAVLNAIARRLGVNVEDVEGGGE